MGPMPNESPSSSKRRPDVDLTAPSPTLIRSLTDRQIDAAAEAWWQVKNTDQYLSGREAVMQAAGYETADLFDLIEADADLAALQQAVKDRLGGKPSRPMKALTSSSRWAYLARAHAAVLSDVQTEALLAGWTAAIVPSKPRRWWSFWRRPVGASRSTTTP